MLRLVMAGMFEYRLWQMRFALWVAIWIALAVFIGIWSVPGAVALLATGVVLMWLMHRHNRGLFGGRPTTGPEAERQEDSPEERQRQARYLVTQLLRELTRVQVSYLCQEFESPKRGLSWLKHALPRSYRPAAEDLQRQLERARRGEAASGTEVAAAAVSRRDEVLRAIDALEAAKKQYPDHLASNPVLFVITEHLTTDEDQHPEVVTLAGWNPTRPALLADVELVNLFSENDKQRQIRGQATLEGMRKALGSSMRRVADDPVIYAVEPLAYDPVGRELKLSKVPLGFVIGTAELM